MEELKSPNAAPSLRQALTQAVDKQASTAAPTTPAPPPSPAAAPREPAEARPARARSQDGRFAAGSEEAPRTSPVAKASEPVAPSEAGDNGPEAERPPAAQAAAPAEAPPRPKAPQALPEVYRRDWDALKPDMQAAILQREGQMSQRLRETAQDRKHRQEFEEVVRPYAGKLTAPPLQRFGELLHTADRLQNGSREEKADLAAQLIQDFGIDMEAFVQRLESGKPLAPQYVDPRLTALEKRLNAQDAQRDEERMAALRQRVDSFAEGKPHFALVQARMARLADMAHMRGEPQPDLDSLYEEACWAEPEVRKLMLSEQSMPGTASAATQRARNASTSPRSSPTVAPVAQDNSIQSLLRRNLR